MIFRCLFSLLLAGVLLVQNRLAAGQAIDAASGQTVNPDYSELFTAYEGDLATLAAVNVHDARLDILADGLNKPWAMEFLDGRELLISEFDGRLLRLDLADGSRREITGLPDIATGQDQVGLLDVELHPRFSENQRIYFSYVSSDEKTGRFFATAVGSAVLVEDRLSEFQQILIAEPFDWSPANFGGALEFGGDGFLYVTVGDRSVSERAQALDRLEGKVLRLNDDGSAAPGNPFVDTPGADPRVYALGLRNPQGLHWDAESACMFAAEHGPLGGDEINLVKAGANFGWPVVTYGMDYIMAPMGAGTHADGMTQPLFYYLPSEAISPLTVYRGAMFPQWDGHILAGALKGKHVSKVALDGLSVRSEYPILGEINGRIRDIKVAPDGAVLVLSQNGKLYRLSRDSTISAEPPPVNNQLLYQIICSGCHDSGGYNAPRLSHPEEWTAVLRRQRQDVYQRAREGVGDMPEKGMCYHCSDEQLNDLVDYMLDRVADKDQ
ncbi:MAG: PQQ-dependent sugar dehydrogenase [Xanthomonadales bacterium]|nr:PQQ-dependent sugar dehydrogenase [Gammaproteobacteria bacterium]NNL96337.1 PQQ-dependent sugar dehydrogenase [Xanthomonadales bacterium]